MKSLDRYLEECCLKFKDNVAVVENQKSFTYFELGKSIEEMASRLQHSGICSEDHVVIQLPNSFEVLQVNFAIYKLGAVGINVVQEYRETEICHIIKETQATAYIYSQKGNCYIYQKNINRIHEEGIHVKCLGIEELKANIKCELCEIKHESKSAVANLMLSGGTTGFPKLAPLEYEQLYVYANAFSEKCNMNEDTKYLAILPIPHKFAFCSPGILGTLLKGGTVIVCDDVNYDSVFKIIEREKVNITSVVPSLLKIWIEVLEWDNSYNLTSLQVLQVGGAPLENRLAEKARELLKCKIQQLYGATESVVCCTDLSDSIETICSCQGKPLLPEDEIKIVDDSGVEVLPGKTGEILAKGPYTITHYYKNENKESFTIDGFFFFFYLGYFDEKYNIHIVGRIKNQINKGGEKISPKEIEEYLADHPYIEESIVAPIPDEILGEKICAFIKAKKDIAIKELRDYLSEKGIAPFKIPDEMYFIDEWPMTPLKKIDIKKLIDSVLNKV